MYLYVELWTAKPAWLTLTSAERQAFMARVAAAGAALAPLGVEMLGSWLNEPDLDQRHDTTYGSVLQLPDKAALRTLETVVRETGWHVYFEQRNSGGPAQDFGALVAHAMAL